MPETSNPTAGAASRDNNKMESHRGRNFTIPQPIAEEQQQSQLESSAETDNKGSPASALIDSVKQFFAPCVGAVDAASLYIGDCRSASELDVIDQGENVAEDVIMRLRERNSVFRQQNKRRNDTLEIPAHGMLFDDDDVSAISSHTLEEMERLRLAQNSRLNNFQMSPGSAASNTMLPTQTDAGQKTGTWNIQKPQDMSNLLGPIGVSASDSSSSHGNELRTDDKPLEESAPPSWGSKADEDGKFKTHPVG